MTIAEGGGPGKAALEGSLGPVLDRIPRPYLYLGILALSCSTAFGLGHMEGRGVAPDEGISISQLATSTPEFMRGQAAAAAAAVPEDTMPAGGEVVASKSGTKYYFPWCGTVKRIKEENKIWFPNREAAEAAGYEPAANCKGM